VALHVGRLPPGRARGCQGALHARRAPVPARHACQCTSLLLPKTGMLACSCIMASRWAACLLKTSELHDLLRKHLEHSMNALPMQMSDCPWNAQHSRPGGWCGLQPARGRLCRSAVKACVQSTYVRLAGVPARVQVQYPDALARMQQDLVNIRIAARFLQARPSPNLTRLSLNSRGSALCRSRHLLVTLSRPRVAGSAARAQPHRAPARRPTAAVRGLRQATELQSTWCPPWMSWPRSCRPSSTSGGRPRQWT